MIKKLCCGLSLIGLLISCSSYTPKKSNRAVASVKSNNELLDLINDIEKAVEKGTTSLKECSSKLSFYYNKLYSMRTEHILPEDLDQDDLDELITSSFKARVGIKEKMKALKVSGKESKACLGEIKNTVRALRYVEDYFIEISYSRDPKLNTKSFVTFEGSGSHFLINDKFKNSFKDWRDLKSGDVILSRGNAYSSAAIARIGDNDTQFSHLTLVYKDELDKLHTIEAHIEVGNVVAPFDAHIGEKNARSVLFRHKNSELAHRAAEIMYKMVGDKQKSGKNIEYDFAMDYHDKSQIFCSEVVYWGFKLAGNELNKDINIPMHKTKFERGLIPFLNVLGIKINIENIDKFDTFGPGDIQFDSRFEMIAEWRNPKNMKDTRFKDMILTKLFELMEKEDYELKPSAGTSISSFAAWMLRRSPLPLPYVSKKLKATFPVNMTVGQLKLFRVLDEVGEAFYKKLSDAQSFEGYSLAPIDMYDVLDEFIKNDKNRYKRYKEYRKQYRRAFNISSYEKRKLHRLMLDNRPLFHVKFHP